MGLAKHGLLNSITEPSWLSRSGKEWFAEGVPIKMLVQRWGTPLYVYSAKAIKENVRRIKSAFAELPVRIFYAVKANSNGAILRLLSRQSLGAEVVSQGELLRALWAGFAPELIIFTGTGKREDELTLAVEKGIHAVVVECLEELKFLRAFGPKVSVALRLNLGIEVNTHPCLTTSALGAKFGLDEKSLTQALKLLRKAHNINLVGLHSHLGSQISQISHYLSAFSCLREEAEDLKNQGFPIKFLDLGGGFAVDFPFAELADALKITDLSGLEIYFEPGRAVVANAGCLITRVLYTKKVHGLRFVVVDAAMNDFLRPALYGAQHPILAEPQPAGKVGEAAVVGPVCESTDRFGFYLIPPLRPGDLLLFLNAGAYGFSMASQYNSRPRPAEILLVDGEPHPIRTRERINDVVRGEKIPKCLI